MRMMMMMPVIPVVLPKESTIDPRQRGSLPHVHQHRNDIPTSTYLPTDRTPTTRYGGVANALAPVLSSSLEVRIAPRTGRDRTGQHRTGLPRDTATRNFSNYPRHERSDSRWPQCASVPRLIRLSSHVSMLPAHPSAPSPRGRHHVAVIAVIAVTVLYQA
jgi:hypothetical protein